MCQKCVTNIVHHIFIDCINLNECRNAMWDEITDIIGVELAANLFNKSDCDQVACLMGASCELCNSKEYKYA